MKITSSELQRNDLASLAFRDAADSIVKGIREFIVHYQTLDKINSTIFGDIRALALLSGHFDGEDNPIMTEEAEQWKAILLDYCERNQRKIPKALRADFLQNLTKDLDAIIEHSHSIPKFLWEKDAQMRTASDWWLGLVQSGYRRNQGQIPKHLSSKSQRSDDIFGKRDSIFDNERVNEKNP